MQETIDQWNLSTRVSISEQMIPSNSPYSLVETSNNKDLWIIECICGRIKCYPDSRCVCKEVNRIEAARLREDSLDYLNAPKKQTWYHATINPFWLQSVIEAKTPVHIGEKQTSEIIGTGFTGRKMHGYFMYELELVNNPSVSPDVCPDLHCNWLDKENLDEFYSHGGYDVHTYINFYESPGTISALVSPEFLSIKSMQWISLNDSTDTHEKVIEVLDSTVASGEKFGISNSRSFKREIQVLKNMQEYFA